MARLKFLLYALVALGLWGAALFVLSPKLAAAFAEQASARSRLAPAAVSAAVQQRRLELLRAGVTALGAEEVLAAANARGRTEAKVVAAARAALKDELSPDVWLAYTTEAGAALARGETEVSAELGELNLAGLSGMGAEGTVVEAFGASNLLQAFPLRQVSGGDVRTLGTLWVGAPILSPAQVDRAARDAQLLSLAVMYAGKPAVQGGLDKALAAKLEKVAPLGGTSVVERGFAAELGPLKLPMLTAGDFAGGQAPLAMASRAAVGGTPFEVIAVASVRPGLVVLAEVQRLWLLAFVALAALSLLWLLVMGSSPVLEPATDPYVQQAASRPSGPKPLASPEPLAVAELPPVPETSPDDFQFPPPAAPAPAAPAASEFFGAPPVPDDELSPAPADPDVFSRFGNAGDDADHVPTKAYPVHPDGAPFFESLGPSGGAPYNPDATRVAAVSDELLRASSETASPSDSPVGVAAPRPLPPPPVAATPVPAANGALADEQHYQDVYREFVATRERCGEPADGLTFDKFAGKLRKNREQLITKYGCRTVRFQVYVKEGKAALKATPVKD